MKDSFFKKRKIQSGYVKYIKVECNVYGRNSESVQHLSQHRESVPQLLLNCHRVGVSTAMLAPASTKQLTTQFLLVVSARLLILGERPKNFLCNLLLGVTAAPLI